MSEPDQARLDDSRAALAKAQKKLEDWIQTNPAENEENMALFTGMRQTITQTQSDVLDLLKTARGSPRQ